jgi:hypothetical protein
MTTGPFLNYRKMKEKTSQYLEDMGVNIPSLDTEVARLSGGQRHSRVFDVCYRVNLLRNGSSLRVSKNWLSVLRRRRSRRADKRRP